MLPQNPVNFPRNIANPMSRWFSIVILAPVLVAQSWPSDERKVEADVLSRLHAFNLLEMRAGHLAKAKGTTSEIRNLGSLLVHDHADLDSRVRNMAAKQGIQLAEPNAEETATQEFQGLELLAGQQFDKSFFEFDGEAHRKFVQELGQYQQQLNSSPTRVLITKIIPILQQHEFLCDWCWHHCLKHR